MITVRPAQPRDAAAWLQLRRALWPEGSEAEHREDIDRFFAGDPREPLAVLLAEDGAGCPVGLAELSIRAYAEGCGSNRVAYLEGWFVVPKARRSGVGQALIDRKSTRLNSSHLVISYAVFCLKKKKNNN